MSVRFFVPGTPVPQGSLKSFAARGTGRVVTPQLPKVIEWRGLIAMEARRHFDRPWDVPVIVELAFYFARPKAHYGTGRNADTLKPSAPHHMSRTPDLDKLVRAVGDGLAGIAFVDDAQIVELFAVKAWAGLIPVVVNGERFNEPGVHVRVGEAGEMIGGDGADS